LPPPRLRLQQESSKFDCHQPDSRPQLDDIAVQLKERMNTISGYCFRANLKGFIEEVVGNHEPFRVPHRGGKAFIVMSEEDWERERERLCVLQNTDLMKQIANSQVTHTQGTAYNPKEMERTENPARNQRSHTAMPSHSRP
jgi:antitoxin YefM